jgi:hypothetical protein
VNERLKELLIKAIREVGAADDDKPGKEKTLEKFAELIIRECIDWCNANARDDGTAQRIAEDIKKDFGVEE